MKYISNAIYDQLLYYCEFNGNFPTFTFVKCYFFQKKKAIVYISLDPF